MYGGMSATDHRQPDGQVIVGADGEIKKRKRGPGKKDRITDPNFPKGVRPAFICFSMARRDHVKDNLPPGAKLTDITKTLSAMWKSMSPEDKQPWEQQSLLDKRRYETQLNEYTASGGTGTRHGPPKPRPGMPPANPPFPHAGLPPYPAAAQQPPRSMPSVEDMMNFATPKPRKTSPPLPEKPLTPYQQFTKLVQIKINEMYPGVVVPDLLRILSDQWKAMVEEQKEDFTEASRLDNQRYEIQTVQYNLERGIISKLGVESLMPPQAMMAQMQQNMQSMQGVQNMAHHSMGARANDHRESEHRGESSEDGQEEDDEGEGSGEEDQDEGQPERKIPHLQLPQHMQPAGHMGAMDNGGGPDGQVHQL